MHLRVKIKFLGAIFVHPVRRQNFAGTGAPYILQHLRLCRMRYVFWCTLLTTTYDSSRDITEQSASDLNLIDLLKDILK